MRNLNLKILVTLATLIWAGSGVGQGQELLDIKDFVQRIHIHGVPYEEASRYDASVVPTLLEMLKDPKEQEHWSNIAATLGMIGDERAVEPMIEFIEKTSKEDKPDRSQRRAKTSAMMALGYLINKSGSQRALDFLTTILKPQARGGGLAATAKRDKELIEDAITGLALSGHRKATEVLTSIRRSLESSDLASPRTVISDFRSEVGEIVKEALRTNKEIAERGLAEYYRRLRP